MSLPLSSGTSFSDVDPAKIILLELLAAALTDELTPRWTTAVAGTPLFASRPIQTKLPAVADSETLKQVKVEFPLLAVGREPTPVKVEQFSIGQPKETWRWDITYILGALEVGNRIALDEALLVAGRTIHLTIDDAGHRAYATQSNDGFTYAKNVLGPGDDCCNFSGWNVIEYMIGPAKFSADGPTYNACSVTLETVEIAQVSVGGFPSRGSYRGASVTLQTGNEQGRKTIITADTAVPLK